ncbi:phospholipid carrier-dependent glycosyltransferase [Acidobacteriota bacterium]
MKRILFIFWLLWLASGLTTANTGENPVKNGGFESIRQQGIPDNWIKHTSGRDRGGISFFLEKDLPYSGRYSAGIENTKSSDSKWVQFLKVKPGTVYRLSCKIKAEGIGKDAIGANISVLGVNAASRDLKDTAGKWVEVVLYGRTGPDQVEIGIAARIGGDGSPNTGRAYFDEVGAAEVENPPPGVSIARFYKEPEPEPENKELKAKRTGRIIFLVIILYTLFWIIYYFVIKRKTVPAAAKSAKSEVPGKISFTRWDYILCGTLTFVYAIIAFINLGSLNVPQTYWQPNQRNESFYVNLGDVKQVERLNYHFGLGKGSYKIEFSEDSQHWSGRKMIEQATQHEHVEWRFIMLNRKARYVRITALRPGVMLNEIGIFERGSRRPLPIVSIERSATAAALTRGKPASVFDEQETVAYYPDFLTGMYFDEVYHARTAYEHLLRLEPTETTHPPLGKVIISAGIALFGMNPFGWRFMGTLFGILMIPIMYAFGLRVFRKTRYAFIAAFLMTFDFMHFTQTRIATIDSFALLFIILMYYFMLKYVSMDIYRDSLKRTLPPLFLSGLFFGLGAACKWITLYGGVGLALIFFTSLYLRFHEYKKSEYAPPPHPHYRVFITLGLCILFFIIIPLITYTLSYIPFMMVPGPGHELGDVADYQVHMYDYHSKLKETHPFSSQWWQWPIMKTPAWYYNGEHNLPEGKTSSIAAFGNPAIWWIGIIAVLASLITVLKNRCGPMLVILTGFACQYLIWAVSPRDCTFIYHFFGALPFMILCITYMIKYLEEKFPKSKPVVYGYLLFVFILFVMFYPILSGMVVSKTYVASFLRWFKTWYFFT